MAAIAKCESLRLAGIVTALRLRHYRSRPAWPTFGRGWTGRCADLLEAIATMPQPSPACPPGCK